MPLSRPFRSGTRLKARYYKHESLPDAFVDMFDTKTQERCRFFATAGGALYCLPRADRRAGLIEIGFLDAACKQPVFMVIKECPAHDPLSIHVGRDCRGEASLHKLESINASIPYYRISAVAPGCAPAGNTGGRPHSRPAGRHLRRAARGQARDRGRVREVQQLRTGQRRVVSFPLRAGRASGAAQAGGRDLGRRAAARTAAEG